MTKYPDTIFFILKKRIVAVSSLAARRSAQRQKKDARHFIFIARARGRILRCPLCGVDGRDGKVFSFFFSPPFLRIILVPIRKLRKYNKILFCKCNFVIVARLQTIIILRPAGPDGIYGESPLCSAESFVRGPSLSIRILIIIVNATSILGRRTRYFTGNTEIFFFFFY